MNNNGCIIPEINEQNIGVQQENATFLVIGDKAYTSEIIEEYNRNAAAKTEEFNTNATNKTNDFNTNYNNKLKAFNDNATTKTTDFDSHVTAQTTNFNNNAETATANFNKNAVQQTDEFNKNAMSYSQGIEENKEHIASTSNELYRLKTDVLETGDNTDTFVHLEDSAWAEMQEIKVDGVLQQETTKGNQLIDFTSVNSISCDVNFKNDTLKITSTKSYSRASKNITELLQNNVGKVLNFTFESIDFSKTLGGRIQLNILKNDGTHLYAGLVETSGRKVSYTIPNDFSDITSIVLEIYSNNTSENSDTELTILKPLLYFENNDSYEPYTGGQPSPSPDYPQEIKTITDSLKVTSCGKNLVERMVLGELNTKTGIFEQSSTIICNERYIPYDSLKQYYIKVDNAPATANIRWYNQKFEYIGYGTTQSSGLINKYVYTDLTSYIPSDTTPKYFKIRRADVALLNSTWCVSTDQNYFGEYVESLITANLPEGEFIGKLDDTYKDVLRAEYDQEDGKYHLKLDKMVGMGDTSKYFGNIKRQSANQDNTYRYSFDIDRNTKIFQTTEPYKVFPILCNKFLKGSRNDNYLQINSMGYGEGNIYSQITMYYSETKNMTITEFSNWLVNNPLIIYYILQTPYTLDLGVIDMPLTYDEITNIFTDSSLLPTINVKYYRNFITTIQNLQVNEKSLKQELVDLNNRLTALENANTGVVDNNPTDNNPTEENPTEESEVTE